MRYAEALGAERFVDTNNVAGVPGSANPFLQNYYKDKGTSERRRDLFVLRSRLRRAVEAPQALVQTCYLQGGADPRQLADARHEARGVSDLQGPRGRLRPSHGVKILKTCTPYLVGQRAGQGRALRVDGDRRRSSTATRCSARAPTPRGARARAPRCSPGKIPDWGFHRDRVPLRHAPHRRRRAGRERHGLGHARLLRRRRRAGAHPGAHRRDSACPISSATSTSARRPRRPAASRCITSSASRRRRRRSRRRSEPQAPRATFTYGRGASAGGPTMRSTPAPATRTSTT